MQPRTYGFHPLHGEYALRQIHQSEEPRRYPAEPGVHRLSCHPRHADGEFHQCRTNLLFRTPAVKRTRADPGALPHCHRAAGLTYADDANRPYEVLVLQGTERAS